jgi:hypothetical protein
MDSWNFLKKSIPKMGHATLAKRKSWLKFLMPILSVLFWNPQVGILAPFAPSNFGPRGVLVEEKGIMLSEAPESTRKVNLLRESCKNIKPEPCENDIAVAV